MDTNLFSALFGQVWNQPASLLVIAALSILAYLLEIWPQFPSRFIPHIIVCVGAIAYPFFANRASVPPGYPNPLAVLVVNGFISGFLSTIMHATLIKWLMNKFGSTPPPPSLSVSPESPPPGLPPAIPVMFACGILTILIVGCGSFYNTAFRSEQTIVATGHAAVHAYNTYYNAATNGLADTNKLAKLDAERAKVLDEARKFGAVAQLYDSALESYRVNSADTNKVGVTLAFDIFANEATNIENLVRFFINPNDPKIVIFSTLPTPITPAGINR